MNRYPIKTALAITVAGFLGATGAMAQTTTPSGTAPTSPPSSSGMKADVPKADAPSKTPMGTSSSTDPTSKSSQSAMPSRSETATAAFAKLDANNRGHVTKEEVSQLQGFNFQGADKNNDGKLDATEFKDAWAPYASKK